MPLKKSNSKKNIAYNFKKLTEENKNKVKKRSRKQIIAIALNVKNKKRRSLYS